jgi:hypothetical protein
MREMSRFHRPGKVGDSRYDPRFDLCPRSSAIAAKKAIAVPSAPFLFIRRAFPWMFRAHRPNRIIRGSSSLTGMDEESLFVVLQTCLMQRQKKEEKGMTQYPFRPGTNEQRLAELLQALSAREQISFLVRATRLLPGRERREVWRVAGFSVLRDRFLPLLVHVLLKRVLAGALWWVVCAIASVLLVLVLVLVEQINPHAAAPVFAAVVSFFAGFSLFALLDFLRSLVQFFRTTSAPSAREELLLRLNTCNDAEKLALLRMMSASLARKVPGESLPASLLTGVVLLGAAAILVGLLVLLSGILPALGSLPWLLLVASLAFLLGLFGPGMVRHRLLVRTIH